MKSSVSFKLLILTPVLRDELLRRQIETMKSRDFALTDWCAKLSQAWATFSRPHGDFGGSIF
jgi:hypothetical protein